MSIMLCDGLSSVREQAKLTNVIKCTGQSCQSPAAHPSPPTGNVQSRLGVFAPQNSTRDLGNK